MSYAKHQKNAIDKLVQEYLATGIIQNSSSPFARPIVLVGKKDGSWRLLSHIVLCFEIRDILTYSFMLIQGNVALAYFSRIAKHNLNRKKKK